MKSKNIKEKKIIPLPKLKKKAQDVFNKWIRNRDRDERCISCNGPVEQAGHYFSSGHYSLLTFCEINVNGQCIRCNCFLHGNLIHYRMGLITKYGERIVRQLEQDSKFGVKKWSRLELEEIIEKYNL